MQRLVLLDLIVWDQAQCLLYCHCLINVGGMSEWIHEWINGWILFPPPKTSLNINMTQVLWPISDDILYKAFLDSPCGKWLSLLLTILSTLMT